MKKCDSWKLLIVGCVVASLIIISFGLVASTRTWGTNIYDCYYVDAPFGRYWTDTEGQFFLASGYITSSLTESYTVKYWKGDKLETIILDAEDTPIIVDGTLRLSQRYTKIVKRIDILETIIYVPFLPEGGYDSS